MPLTEEENKEREKWEFSEDDKEIQEKFKVLGHSMDLYSIKNKLEDKENLLKL